MNKINLEIFLKMLENGKNNLANHQNVVDALNVFPVPDGDTGSNMTMTFTAGVNDTLKSNHKSIAEASKALSRGLLMGARGNSGVILSQIFRGVANYLQNVEVVDAKTLACAFNEGAVVAYKAVIKPVEGTILTVIREAAYYTLHYAEDNMSCVELFEKFVAEAHASLERTPELLPILKEANVVDSGGRGLVYILEGFLEALKGNVITSEKIATATSNAAVEHDHEEFGYCTEFIIRLDTTKYYSEEKLKEELLSIGNSLVVVSEDDLVKVHVHTLTPGVALNFGQQYGEFVKLKIENMQEQHENLTVSQPKSKFGLIAVGVGEGVTEMFKSLRVDYVVSGGQTMNPSTEDFVSAIEKVNAETIYILPNNSNIILAAQQASEIVEDKHVIVIPSKSFPQGMNACMMYNPDGKSEDNTNNMLAAIEEIQTGQITYAVKDTVFDGIEIKENEFIAIKEKSIIASSVSKKEALKNLLNVMINEDSEVVYLLVGEDVSEEEQSEIESYIEATFDIELEVYQGNQPVYSFIVGVI